MDQFNKIYVAEMPTNHKIDISKVKTIEDVKLILDYLEIGVFEGTPAYESLKHLL